METKKIRQSAFRRIQNFSGLGQESCFFFGPRQSGKSTLLRTLFPHAPYYDLLHSDTLTRLQRRPHLLREEYGARPIRGPVILDEVQKVPQLLDEVQALIVEQHAQFILCGSSARKLKRGSANLLGGRALHYELFPLVSAEIPDFDLLRALNHGLVPRHYLADDALPLVRAYVNDYLQEEIAAEALTRNIPAFARFLELAAFSNGEIIQYQNIASECGVSAPTVKEYFQILFDTLLAHTIPSFRKRPKRRVIQAPKLYLFDVGIANMLLKRSTIEEGSESFGRAFEHLIIQELIAHRQYSRRDYPLAYWRTTSGFEVDCVLGDGAVALEIKGTHDVRPLHCRGLRSFREEYRPKRSLIVSLDPSPRVVDGVTVMPWRDFLSALWSGEIM